MNDIEEKKLAVEDSKAVQSFLGKLNLDNPFPEHESYYSRSSHSEHDNMFVLMHVGGMRNIFTNTSGERVLGEYPHRDTGAYGETAVALEKLFLVGHALSAVYSELHQTDGMVTAFYGSGHPNWFHGPFSGEETTLSDKWDGDSRVPIGYVLDAPGLKSEPLIVQAYKAYRAVYDGSYKKVWREEPDEDGYSVRIPERIPDFQEDLVKLHVTLKGIVIQLTEQIRTYC